jgi:hypothetical protein
LVAAQQEALHRCNGGRLAIYIRPAAAAAYTQRSPSNQEKPVKRIDIVKKNNVWVGESGGQSVRGTRAPTKVEAVKKTAAAARRDPQPVSVKIHKLNGRIGEERTYPSSADPHRSKG